MIAVRQYLDVFLGLAGDFFDPFSPAPCVFVHTPADLKACQWRPDGKLVRRKGRAPTMPDIEIPHWHLVNGTNGTACDTDGTTNTVAIGIMIGLISSIGINVGQNLQSIGMKSSPEAQENPCSSRTWIIGLAIFVTGSLGNMVAMAFASASILVPLESSQFVTNIFFSQFILRIKVTPRQWLGTFLAVFGTVLTCVFGPNDSRCFTLGQLQNFYVKRRTVRTREAAHARVARARMPAVTPAPLASCHNPAALPAADQPCLHLLLHRNFLGSGVWLDVVLWDRSGGEAAYGEPERAPGAKGCERAAPRPLRPLLGAHRRRAGGPGRWWRR